MIHVFVDVQDRFSDELEQFGKRAPTIALRICRTIGQEFRKFTKKNYLRGQVIGKRTGELYKNIKIVTDKRSKNAVIVKPWARLANIYHNPEGATITPVAGKALKFETKDGRIVFTKRVRLAPRPWMRKATSEFSWAQEIPRAAEKVLNRELKKLEAKYGSG